jgi:circadian clock protein KaiC
MVGGGFPRGRVLLVLGEPGAGKTVFCSQFLMNGITRFGENGLLISMDESKVHYAREMAQFGWDVLSAEKQEHFSFVDASPIRALPSEIRDGRLVVGRQDFSIMSLLKAIREGAKKVSAKRVVVDSISLYSSQFPDANQNRKALLDLVEVLSETGATCLLTAELRRVGIQGRAIQVEEYLAHGVVIMQTIRTGRNMERTIQVEKMRETQIDRQPRPYRVTDKGIEVYSRENVI